MRIHHFETLAPFCPSCRAGQVEIVENLRGDDAQIHEGILRCGNPECVIEFPIIDGIPILVSDVKQFVTDQQLGILARTDLTETMLGLVSECCGSGSTLDTDRQYLSTYIWGHYGDLDPGEPQAKERPGQIIPILDRGVARLKKAKRSLVAPILDVGCSVGRSCFHLAAETARGNGGTGPLVLGCDMNFGMLRVARTVLAEGALRYARRRVGCVYEDRSITVPVVEPQRIDFWCADALALPFAQGSFDLAVSMNLIDCVSSPIDHLRYLRDIVRPGGGILLASPFDWSAGATPLESWVGGRSPRTLGGGSTEATLRTIFNGEHPYAIKELTILEEADNLEWTVRSHERSLVRYLVDLFVLARDR